MQLNEFIPVMPSVAETSIEISPLTSFGRNDNCCKNDDCCKLFGRNDN